MEERTESNINEGGGEKTSEDKVVLLFSRIMSSAACMSGKDTVRA